MARTIICDMYCLWTINVFLGILHTAHSTVNAGVNFISALWSPRQVTHLFTPVWDILLPLEQTPDRRDQKPSNGLWNDSFVNRGFVDPAFHLLSLLTIFHLLFALKLECFIALISRPQNIFFPRNTFPLPPETLFCWWGYGRAGGSWLYDLFKRWNWRWLADSF